MCGNGYYIDPLYENSCLSIKFDLFQIAILAVKIALMEAYRIAYHVTLIHSEIFLLINAYALMDIMMINHKNTVSHVVRIVNYVKDNKIAHNVTLFIH